MVLQLETFIRLKHKMKGWVYLNEYLSSDSIKNFYRKESRGVYDGEPE